VKFDQVIVCPMANIKCFIKIYFRFFEFPVISLIKNLVSLIEIPLHTFSDSLTFQFWKQSPAISDRSANWLSGRNENYAESFYAVWTSDFGTNLFRTFSEQKTRSRNPMEQKR